MFTQYARILISNALAKCVEVVTHVLYAIFLPKLLHSVSAVMFCSIILEFTDTTRTIFVFRFDTGKKSSEVFRSLCENDIENDVEVILNDPTARS